MTSLNKYRDPYLKCRSRKSHYWEDAPDDLRLGAEYPASAVIERIPERCPRCDGFKVAIWNMLTGDIIATPRRMPEAYSMRGPDRVTLAETRIEYIKRRRGRKKSRP